MAALLKFAPTHGVVTAAGSISRLNSRIEGALRREWQAPPMLVQRRAHGRPTLVCHWRKGADGPLSCTWDIEVLGAPIPPL